MLVLILGLLAVRLVRNEREQARCRGQEVTHIRLMGPLPMVQEGIDTWLHWLNGAEGWHCSIIMFCERPRAFRQENPLSCMGEAMGPSAG